MDTPQPSPEQIAYDLYYLETNKASKSAPIGCRKHITHDLKDVGKVLVSKRWFRVWERTNEGWKFLGMSHGRNNLVKI